MLALGAFTPLEGFAAEADWRSVCEQMCLANGVFWPIPITMSAATTDGLNIGSDYGLTCESEGAPMAILHLSEVYAADLEFEATTVFGTADPDHPGVAEVLSRSHNYLAGAVTVLNLGPFEDQHGAIVKTPAETRTLFDELGWQTVAAFQTRNPLHRSHEQLIRIALETHDGVFIHSLLGQLKPGDIPADVRVRAIAALLDNHLPANRVIHAGYPLDMRYAGPREALLHAVFRQNYGCTHLIVGRDHAGVGEFYDPFAAQRIFSEIPEDALEIQPINFEAMFWCEECADIVSASSCTHDEGSRLSISGTRLREMLANGEDVPEGYSRKEVVEVLRDYYESGVA